MHNVLYQVSFYVLSLKEINDGPTLKLNGDDRVLYH